MLTTYLTQTARLLQNPQAPTSLYSTADLTAAINTARGQLAGEAECIRILGTISTVASTRNYNFASINTGVSATNGVGGAINLRRIMYAIGDGQKWIAPRNWEWFDLYHLNNPVPITGAPQVWAQYAQGVTGSFYLDPPPDAVYVLTADAVCYPIDLADNSTVEAIPQFWQDAVCFFAAYYALLSSNVPARQADANRMYERYEEFVMRARRSSNPSVNRFLYQQSTDVSQANKLALPQQKQQGAA